MSESPVKDAPASSDVAAPKQQQAPVNPHVETLQSAFPEIDAAVISAVLMASGNDLERSFDALLGMSDPSHKPDLPAAGAGTAALSDEQKRQIEADEELAHQIRLEDRAYSKFNKTQRQRQQAEASPAQPERSFLDDELPVIKETLIQGFNETKTKVSGFLANLKDQFDAQMQGPPSTSTMAAAPRPSTDRSAHDRPRQSLAYEADPDAVAVLDEDFSELELHDSSSKAGKPAVVKSRSSQEAIKARAQSASKWEKIESQKKPAASNRDDNFDIGSDD